MCFRRKTLSLNKWNLIYWLLHLVSSVISCMDAKHERCEDAELKTQLGVERCGLDACLPLEVWWLVCSNGAEDSLYLCQTFCLPHFLLDFFLLVHLFFFSPHNSHSFSAAPPVAQHCDTSLASIIPGSDEPTGRGQCVKDISSCVGPVTPSKTTSVWPTLYLTIPKQAERM